jgi:hypothetical protein
MSQRSLEEFGAYVRMTHWLGDDVIRQRTALADEIIGVLTATIERLRVPPTPPAGGTIREEENDYGR